PCSENAYFQLDRRRRKPFGNSILVHRILSTISPRTEPKFSNELEHRPKQTQFVWQSHLGDAHISEHAFQLRGELIATFCFEFGDHAPLRVVTAAATSQ